MTVLNIHIALHTFLINLQMSSVATAKHVHVSLHFGCTFNISFNFLSSHRFTNPGTHASVDVRGSFRCLDAMMPETTRLILMKVV